MSRCYYLQYVSKNTFLSDNDTYICKLCGKEMLKDDLQVKYTCDSQYEDSYKNCPVYKERKY